MPSGTVANKRAAGYVRVSTIKQADEGFSLAEQERKVRERIASEGWSLTNIFVERGVSGKKDDRAELAALMAGLDDVDVLVIPSLDRLGRSNAHLQQTFEALTAADVTLVSLREHLDGKNGCRKPSPRHARFDGGF